MCLNFRTTARSIQTRKPPIIYVSSSNNYLVGGRAEEARRMDRTSTSKMHQGAAVDRL